MEKLRTQKNELVFVSKLSIWVGYNYMTVFNSPNTASLYDELNNMNDGVPHVLCFEDKQQLWQHKQCLHVYKHSCWGSFLEIRLTPF